MKRKWIYSVLVATVIFCGIDVCFGGGNCANLDEEERSWEPSAGLTIPDNFIGELNASIKQLLPTLTCVINKGASITGSGTQQDCCDDDEVVPDGIKNAELTATLGGSVSGNLVGGQYSVTKPIDFLNKHFNIKAEFDIGLSLACAGTGTIAGGYVQDDCIGDDWTYGGLALNLVPAFTAGATSMVCIETDNKTNGLTVVVQLAEVSASFTGTVGYNTAESESGWYGDAVLNNVRCTSSVDFPFIDPISATYEFYPTPGHWLTEGE